MSARPILDPIAPCGTLRAMIAPSRPPSNVVPCRNAHLQYLCERMRPDEIEQYVALTGAREYDAEVAARGFMNISGLKFTVLGADCLPVAAGGYEEVSPGVWNSWMVGSMDGWGTSWRSMTKAARWLMDGLFEMGARRLQTQALASRVQAIDWYERSLGLVREGTLRKLGRNGEDVACFARVAEG